MAPTIARLSPFSSSPTRELDFPLHSTSLNTMCKAGNQTLHDYRQYMSSYDSSTIERPDSRTLRRKNAALNLNQSQVSLDNIFNYSFSVSSVTSSPPPLSPSHSPSALSEQPESLDGFLPPGTPRIVDMNPENAYLRQNPHKILDTFRDRLERYPDPDLKPIPRPGHEPPVSVRSHTKTYSDSMLLNVKKPTATIIHHGTSFEILNPHESLHFSRIVSYIEDVDSYSTGRNRDSYISTITEDTIIIEEDPWSHNTATQSQALEGEDQKTRLDIGDTQGYHHQMPSINGLLEETDLNMTKYLDSRPRPYTNPFDESDLGEPGSPVYEDNQPMIPHDALWQYDIGRDPTNSHPYNPTVQEMVPKTEIHIHRKPTRRSSTSRKKRKGPFGKLCGLLRKKRFFPGKAAK
ncbi:hypothetical protein BBP40_009553 [Aspergillus hancockii]|nr:hypothetical protein BBP40_009553 [Aspergillus hancockii]